MQTLLKSSRFSAYAVGSRQAQRHSSLWPSQVVHTCCCCSAGHQAAVPATAAAAADPVAGKQLPRFYTSQLPTVVGAAVELDPDEAKHAVRVLRLQPGDAVQLCDGKGGLVECEIAYSTKNSATVVATAAPQHISWTGPKWIVAAACLTLKGGRTDWLVEKATELGAHALLPLITQRSQTGTSKAKFKSLSARSGGSSSSSSESEASSGDFQPSRLQRLALAATKQSLRVHALQLLPATTLVDLLPELAHSPVSLVATAGAPPVLQVLEQALKKRCQATIDGTGGMEGCAAAAAASAWHEQQQQPCFLLVGPEGDFTDEEVERLAASGVLPAGLGPHRLRTETAAMAMLSAAVLFSDAR